MGNGLPIGNAESAGQAGRGATMDPTTEDVDQAVADYTAARDRERATMYTAEDKPIYSQQEHQKRLPAYEQRQAAHRERLRSTLSDLGTRATTAQTEADRELRALRL